VRDVKMHADLNEHLMSLADRIAELKDERARVEGQIQTLEVQRKAVLDGCRDMGVDPDKLDNEIELKEKSLHSLIQDIEKALTDIEFRRDEVIKRERDKERKASSNGE